MRLFFVDDVLCTKVTAKGTTEKTYDNVLVDTGAFKSGLPSQDCMQLELQFDGAHDTTGLFGEDMLLTYNCQFAFEDNDLHNLPVLALPLNEAIIGRDILSKYKLIIDWTKRIATAERLL